MKTLTTLPMALLLGTLLFTASPATGQVGMIPDEDCRCVDPDGNEIENCRCFRTFEPGQMAWSVAPFGGSGARIGITLTVSPGEDDTRGARVTSVLEDGPADKAGILEGDVITHIGGHSLFDPLSDEEEEELDLDAALPSQRLLRLARALEPGEEVEIRYLRDGEDKTATLVAEELDEWGGRVMMFGPDWEGQWDLEEFRGGWAEPQEFHWEFKEGEPQVLFRRHREGEDPEVIFREWKEGEPQVLLRRFREGEDPEVVFRRFEEGQDPEVFFQQWEEGEPRVFAFGNYFSACPVTDEGENVFIVGTDCIGGLRMEELNPKLGEYFGTEEGVLVADVHEDSRLGLEAGDVILGIGDRDVSGPAQMRRILRSYDPEEEITLRIMRQKREMTVTGTVGR
jgi:hypothetical protein